MPIWSKQPRICILNISFFSNISKQLTVIFIVVCDFNQTVHHYPPTSDTKYILATINNAYSERVGVWGGAQKFTGERKKRCNYRLAPTVYGHSWDGKPKRRKNKKWNRNVKKNGNQVSQTMASLLCQCVKETMGGIVYKVCKGIYKRGRQRWAMVDLICPTARLRQHSRL